MKFSKILMSSAVVVAAFSGTQAYAAPAPTGPTLTDVLGASGITVGGALDVSYDWSKNDLVTLRQFDTENDAAVLHQVNTSVSKTFTNGIGATVNVILGEDANVVSGDGSDDFDLTQAYLSGSHGNFSAIGGRFVSLAGMEVINPAGNINASRSLLFFFQPLVHTGGRGTFKINDMISVTGGVNNAQFGGTRNPNGGGLRNDNNTDQTFEAQVALTPAKNLSVYLTGYVGNEDDGGPGADADIRADTVDLVVNFNLTDMIYFGLNADYFNREDGAGGHFETKGVAGYAQVKFLPKWRVAVRSEYIDFDDEAAAFNSTSNYLRENTLTLAHACTENLELLVEGRHDRATGDADSTIFANIDGTGGEGGFSGDDDQYTATFKAILKF